jgi:hypothetical protein
LHAPIETPAAARLLNNHMSLENSIQQVSGIIFGKVYSAEVVQVPVMTGYCCKWHRMTATLYYGDSPSVMCFREEH